jgi:hypothetical protein
VALDAILDTGADSRRPAATATAVLFVAALCVAGWTHSSRAGETASAGIEAGHLVAAADLPEDQTRLETIGVINHLAAWIPYGAGVDTGALAGAEDLATLAADHPDHLLLASSWCGSDVEICVPVTGGGGSRTDHGYRLVTSADALAATLSP